MGPAAPEYAAAAVAAAFLPMLSQRRIVSLVNLLAMQGALLCIATLLLHGGPGSHHLYVSSALTLGLK